MKKNLASIVIVFMSLLFASCSKLVDYIESHEGGKGGTNPGSYRISAFHYPKTFEFGDSMMTIAYNSAGNPVTATRNEPKQGNNDWEFSYDGQGRLVRLQAFDHGGFDDIDREWDHKYFYDASNRIIKDSIYSLVPYLIGPPYAGDTNYVQAVYYTYDSKDRIIRAIMDDGFGNFSTTDYVYDMAGNLESYANNRSAYPVRLMHDNKTNFRSTNKIWQFLGRDYSVNNPIVGPMTYNSAGLPTNIAFSDTLYGNISLIKGGVYDEEAFVSPMGISYSAVK